MSSAVATSEFTAFCDFVVLVRDAGVTSLTPEQVVAQFRDDHERWRRWYEGNVISMEQARRGEAKPLDLEATMARLRKRLADEGIVE